MPSEFHFHAPGIEVLTIELAGTPVLSDPLIRRVAIYNAAIGIVGLVIARMGKLNPLQEWHVFLDVRYILGHVIPMLAILAYDIMARVAVEEYPVAA